MYDALVQVAIGFLVVAVIVLLARNGPGTPPDARRTLSQGLQDLHERVTALEERDAERHIRVLNTAEKISHRLVDRERKRLRDEDDEDDEDEIDTSAALARARQQYPLFPPNVPHAG